MQTVNPRTFASFVNSLCELEKEVEKERIKLANSNITFDSFSCFRKIDKSGNGFLVQKDLYHFLKDIDVTITESEVNHLYTRHDNNVLEKITYNDFLFQILPHTNLELRNKCLDNFSKLTSEMKQDEQRLFDKLIYDVYTKEIEYHKQLSRYNLSLDQIFNHIEKNCIGTPSFKSLEEFLTTNGFQFTKDDYEIILRRGDRDRFSRKSIFFGLCQNGNGQNQPAHLLAPHLTPPTQYSKSRGNSSLTKSQSPNVAQYQPAPGGYAGQNKSATQNITPTRQVTQSTSQGAHTSQFQVSPNTLAQQQQQQSLQESSNTKKELTTNFNYSKKENQGTKTYDLSAGRRNSINTSPNIQQLFKTPEIENEKCQTNFNYKNKNNGTGTYVNDFVKQSVIETHLPGLLQSQKDVSTQRIEEKQLLPEVKNLLDASGLVNGETDLSKLPPDSNYQFRERGKSVPQNKMAGQDEPPKHYQRSVYTRYSAYQGRTKSRDTSPLLDKSKDIKLESEHIIPVPKTSQILDQQMSTLPSQSTRTAENITPTRTRVTSALENRQNNDQQFIDQELKGSQYLTKSTNYKPDLLENAQKELKELREKLESKSPYNHLKNDASASKRDYLTNSNQKPTNVGQNNHGITFKPEELAELQKQTKIEEKQDYFKMPEPTDVPRYSNKPIETIPERRSTIVSQDGGKSDKPSCDKKGAELNNDIDMTYKVFQPSADENQNGPNRYPPQSDYYQPKSYNPNQDYRSLIKQRYYQPIDDQYGLRDRNMNVENPVISNDRTPYQYYRNESKRRYSQVTSDQVVDKNPSNQQYSEYKASDVAKRYLNREQQPVGQQFEGAQGYPQRNYTANTSNYNENPQYQRSQIEQKYLNMARNNEPNKAPNLNAAEVVRKYEQYSNPEQYHTKFSLLESVKTIESQLSPDENRVNIKQKLANYFNGEQYGEGPKGAYPSYPQGETKQSQTLLNSNQNRPLDPYQPRNDQRYSYMRRTDDPPRYQPSDITGTNQKPGEYQFENKYMQKIDLVQKEGTDPHSNIPQRPSYSANPTLPSAKGDEIKTNNNEGQQVALPAFVTKYLNPQPENASEIYQRYIPNHNKPEIIPRNYSFNNNQNQIPEPTPQTRLREDSSTKPYISKYLENRQSQQYSDGSRFMDRPQIPDYQQLSEQRRELKQNSYQLSNQYKFELQSNITTSEKPKPKMEETLERDLQLLREQKNVSYPPKPIDSRKPKVESQYAREKYLEINKQPASSQSTGQKPLEGFGRVRELNVQTDDAGILKQLESEFGSVNFQKYNINKAPISKENLDLENYESNRKQKSSPIKQSPKKSSPKKSSPKKNSSPTKENDGKNYKFQNNRFQSMWNKDKPKLTIES